MTVAFCSSAQVDGFQLPYNPDSEPDGYIGASDVLALLSFYGQSYSADNFYLSDDSSHVMLDVGVRKSFSCKAMCAGLSGSWRVATTTDLWRHWVDLPYGSWWVSDGVESHDFMVYHMHKNSPNTTPQVELQAYNTSGLVTSNEGCLCATQERPKVEYGTCQGQDGDFQECCEAKVAAGWYPLSGVALDQIGPKYQKQAFWRWAD